MRLEYDLRPEDYLRFSEYHNIHSSESRAKTQRYFIGIALLVVGAALVLSGIGYPLHSPFFACLALMPILAVYSRKVRFQRAVERNIEEARQMGYFSRCTLTASSEGILTECEMIKSQRQWRAICRVVSDGPGIGLYLSSATVILVPDGAFSEGTGRQAFLDAVMKYREQAAGLDSPS